MTTVQTDLCEAVDIITDRTGLDDNGATALIMYGTITHNLTHLQRCPILVIKGPTETGKTTSMLILKEISAAIAEPISDPTKAVFRDSMMSDALLIVEEADEIDELLLTNRYSRDTPVTINRNLGNGTFMRDSRKVFGAMVLHRRQPFRDPASDTRCIMIETLPKKPENIWPYFPGRFDMLLPGIKMAAKNILHVNIATLPAGRANYNWGLLKLAYQNFTSDTIWLEWADEQITKTQQNTVQGREWEPAIMVWSAIVSLVVNSEHEFQQTPSVKYRVYLRDVGKALMEEGLDMNGHQVGQLVRQVGFEIRRARGHQWVYPGTLQYIQEIGKRLGVEDELLEW